MLAVVWRLRVRDVHEVRIEVVEVGLHETDAEGQDCVQLRASDNTPSCGKRAARLVQDACHRGSCCRRKRREAGQEELGEQHLGRRPDGESYRGVRDTAGDCADFMGFT